MAVTSSKTIYRQMYGPLIPGVHIADYPYCLQCDVRKAMPSSDYTVGRLAQRSFLTMAEPHSSARLWRLLATPTGPAATRH